MYSQGAFPEMSSVPESPHRLGSCLEKAPTNGNKADCASQRARCMVFHGPWPCNGSFCTEVRCSGSPAIKETTLFMDCRLMIFPGVDESRTARDFYWDS